MHKETTGLNGECGDAELHAHHLCYIVSQGFDLTDERCYRALLEDPKFKCDHCGRTANRDQNLCVPVQV
jgi:hypothetical protein